MFHTIPRHTKRRILMIMSVLIVLSLLIVIMTARTNQTGSASARSMQLSNEELLNDNVEMGSQEVEMLPPETPTFAAPQQAKRFSPQPPPQEQESHIIKTASLTLRVPSIDRAVTDATAIAHQYDGDITNAYFATNRTTQKTGTLTLKVPVEHIDNAISDLKKLASLVEQESLNTNDVTERVVDLEVLRQNKKAQEARLRAFYDRAETVEDLLKIEQRLTTVRGEIERLDAQYKRLTTATTYSTITLHLIEDAQILPPQKDWRPGQVAKEAVHNLVRKTQHLINTAINVVIEKLPLFFLSLFSLWLLYIVGKKILLHVTQKITTK